MENHEILDLAGERARSTKLRFLVLFPFDPMYV
jgi:hypothetical protein